MKDFMEYLNLDGLFVAEIHDILWLRLLSSNRRDSSLAFCRNNHAFLAKPCKVILGVSQVLSFLSASSIQIESEVSSSCSAICGRGVENLLLYNDVCFI
jgi:hypothetical protein